MPTETTPNLGLPLPHQDNALLTDVARLRTALGMIDTALFGKATPADIDNAIAAVLGTAPAALNTLDELANALGDDANFAASVTTALATKLTQTQGDARYAALADGISSAERTKLTGIASGATANATNAELRDRTTHTGEQAISTITGLQTALDGKVATSAQTGFMNLAAFTTAGAQTWTCPAGVTRAKVTVIGGGGNGGSSGSGGAGGGGGAGGCSIKYFSTLVPGTVYNLTVGAQGASSSFTGPGGITPTGNGGGNGSSAGVTTPTGAGGTASGGDLNLSGQGGATGFYSGSGACSGAGGASILGGGVSVVSGQVAGVAGGAPGAGGGGAVAVSGSNQSGGAGQPGAILIEY